MSNIQYNEHEARCYVACCVGVAGSYVSETANKYGQAGKDFIVLVGNVLLAGNLVEDRVEEHDGQHDTMIEDYLRGIRMPKPYVPKDILKVEYQHAKDLNFYETWCLMCVDSPYIRKAVLHLAYKNKEEENDIQP